MKKRTEKKLTLGKIKIASLSETYQQKIQGGMINPTRTACNDGGGCTPRNTIGCTTGYMVCSC